MSRDIRIPSHIPPMDLASRVLLDRDQCSVAFPVLSERVEYEAFWAKLVELASTAVVGTCSYYLRFIEVVVLQGSSRFSTSDLCTEGFKALISSKSHQGVIFGDAPIHAHSLLDSFLSDGLAALCQAVENKSFSFEIPKHQESLGNPITFPALWVPVVFFGPDAQSAADDTTEIASHIKHAFSLSTGISSDRLLVSGRPLLQPVAAVETAIKLHSAELFSITQIFAKDTECAAAFHFSPKAETFEVLFEFLDGSQTTDSFRYWPYWESQSVVSIQIESFPSVNRGGDGN